jgi:hypothetical protein
MTIVVTERPVTAGNSVSFTNNKTTIERLISGRERIKRGWCRGRYYRESEEGQILSYCMLGSILDETGLLDQTTRRAGVALIDVIDNIYGKLVYETIQDFNDDIKRKKSDVITVFNIAIRNLRGTD